MTPFEHRGSALDLIGGTRLVTLTRMHRGPGRVVAKAEFLQPGGSVKDRPAKAILFAAAARGDLRSGRPIVALTSGNMGAGLAVVANVMGHRFVAVMSAGNDISRVRMLRELGAEVVRVPQVNGTPGKVTGDDLDAAEAAARRIARERDAFIVDQFSDPASLEAHRMGTGPELWQQTEGRLHAFVACVGTGGTLLGTAACLKAMNPHVYSAAVEPRHAAILAGRTMTNPQHLLQGAGYGRVPPLWDASLVDGFLTVSDEEATETREQLATLEGLHVGFTAAANVCAAIRLLREAGNRGLAADATVATVLTDTGLKYTA